MYVNFWYWILVYVKSFSSAVAKWENAPIKFRCSNFFKFFIFSISKSLKPSLVWPVSKRIDCKIGDYITLYPDIYKEANKIHTIAYELMTSISNRVPRIYKANNKIIGDINES